MASRIRDGHFSGGSNLASRGSASLQALLRSHEGLRIDTVNGAANGSSIAVSGITTNDQLLSVVEFASGVPSDRSEYFAIEKDGYIQGSYDTTGDKLVITWRDADGEVGTTSTSAGTETTTTTTTAP